MANQQAVKQRIKSVSNTKQITKAMQLVAASKLRKAQEAAIGPKDYIITAKQLLASLAWHPDALNNPLFAVPATTKDQLVLIITSDRGLAGAYNANVLKAATAVLKQSEGTNYTITIGKYASRFVSRLKDVQSIGAFNLDVKDLELEIVKPILSEIISNYSEKKYVCVTVIYTNFISTVRQDVTVETLLPIAKSDQSVSDRAFEPSAETVFEYAITRTLEAEMLQYLLESLASEHASRMLAMKNATDNANDLIEDLTLEYNNARQAKITQELAEISAGAEAIS